MFKGTVGRLPPSLIDSIPHACCGGCHQWRCSECWWCFVLKIAATPNSINPCSFFFFFLPRPHACLSPVLYSRVFSLMLYLTRGKMNAVCASERGKMGSLCWNRRPLFLKKIKNPECRYKRCTVSLQGFRECDTGHFFGRVGACFLFFFFSVVTNKRQCL